MANSPKIEHVIFYTYDNDTFKTMLNKPMPYVKEVRLCLQMDSRQPYFSAKECKKIFPELKYLVSCRIKVCLLCFEDKCVNYRHLLATED